MVNTDHNQPSSSSSPTLTSIPSRRSSFSSLTNTLTRKSRSSLTRLLQDGKGSLTRCLSQVIKGSRSRPSLTNVIHQPNEVASTTQQDQSVYPSLYPSLVVEPSAPNLDVLSSDGQELSVGDKVRVVVSCEDDLKRLQEGHGGWIPRMTKLIGQEGFVHRITVNADVRVKFSNSRLRWTFNPMTLQKVPSENPSLGIIYSPTSTDQQTLEYLKVKVNEIEEQFSCPICMERVKNVVFLCGHSACTFCATDLSHCHMCREPIVRKINVY